MSAIPYMPLYIADYLADAGHLSTLEHGAYLLLIMNYWQRGEELPNDDIKLARIARMHLREWKRIRPQLQELFALSHKGWNHKRIEHELAIVRAKSLKARKAGLASVDAKLQRKWNGRSTDVEQTFNHTDTDTDTDTDKKEKREAAASAANGHYAFEGEVIKLTERDLKKWERAYHSILDVEAELLALDGWFLTEAGAPKAKDWFYTTRGALNRKHQENLKDAKREDAERWEAPLV